VASTSAGWPSGSWPLMIPAPAPGAAPPWRATCGSSRRHG
jgi:hypothetical protein